MVTKSGIWNDDLYQKIKYVSNAVFHSVIQYVLLITGCEIGTFGKGCSYQCRGHCLNNVPCNSTTGHCDSGCAPGYAEPFCNKSMNFTTIL